MLWTRLEHCGRRESDGKATRRGMVNRWVCSREEACYVVPFGQIDDLETEVDARSIVCR